ncbi:MAG: hypothetical protein K1X39_13400 [Thermoflexales bacterium]|nr:hypothetical protein [Thermoflexales bacterium]
MADLFPQPVAVLHQAAPAPAVRGARKPMKRGGYRDSGADIAFILRRAGIQVITPEPRPRADRDTGWTFPDTEEGVREALAAGATVLWANTVLHADHPLTHLTPRSGVRIVGQPAGVVERYDDKFVTNALLREAGLPVADSWLIADDAELPPAEAGYPLVVKPNRGRGSEGVRVVADPAACQEQVRALRAAGRFGQVCMAEAYLPGIECAVTVMPPGRYEVGIAEARFSEPWALPPVIRLNHIDGVAPYSGDEPVSANSRLIDAEERMGMRYAALLRQCERAAALIGARAPIRLDCREDAAGVLRLFDANMKPNMTGPGRPGRDDQDSLTAIAARAVGWSYDELLVNMLRQAWGEG